MEEPPMNIEKYVSNTCKINYTEAIAVIAGDCCSVIKIQNCLVISHLYINYIVRPFMHMRMKIGYNCYCIFFTSTVMSLGNISQAKGSSYVEIGETKVCCGVYGPKDIEKGHDFKMAGQVMLLLLLRY